MVESWVWGVLLLCFRVSHFGKNRLLGPRPSLDWEGLGKSRTSLDLPWSHITRLEPFASTSPIPTCIHIVFHYAPVLRSQRFSNLSYHRWTELTTHGSSPVNLPELGIESWVAALACYLLPQGSGDPPVRQHELLWRVPSMSRRLESHQHIWPHETKAN